MGFLDKAKQAAQQAQQKLEEKQGQFNAKQAEKAGAGAQGPAVTYDKHGQPITPDPSAAGAPAPGAEPAPAGDPLAPPPAAEPAPAPEGQGGGNATPDPFRPIQ